MNFHEPGKFIKLSRRIQMKHQLDLLQATVSQAVKKTGIASAAKLATIQPKRAVDETNIPDLEWWDAYILNDGVTRYVLKKLFILVVIELWMRLECMV